MILMHKLVTSLAMSGVLAMAVASSHAQPAEGSAAAPTASGASDSAAAAAVPIIGPASDNPRELLELLSQRKRVLDRREESLRASEERLTSLKGEVEQLVARAE